ncbi:ABC transporter ATP-binding protein [Limimaricola sp. G21655-S1]|uniref:ABC transporter ATP-binding protein n=1 Tax=Limimaricola sp. G21655-S1 TaxID=3014768 RepID=UPI0022AEDA89|nr:ABC transporter ATP-binding protein [Limimaricola sp. G21655-S1]MCZ4262536.1 ABC transporter ATP-binding protein [Limimaricola sp. G21655-S1]
MNAAVTKLSGAERAPDTKPSVLSVEELEISVRTSEGPRVLVQDLSFDLARGETLAIAGESGSGKSLTSLAIMGLLPPPAVHVSGGRIRLGEADLLSLSERRMRALRGARVAMIFQEPMTSLNPVLTIGRQLIEAIEAHETLSRREVRARAIEALRAVRMSQPEARLKQYPHELSGGMRQRVMIAMAIALRPDVLIADEPTTALDVTVQREVLELLRDLQRDLGTAVILITHDMGVVAEMADRVVVMQAGRMVEQGPVQEIFAAPKEPYTRALLAAVPRMGRGEGAGAPSTAVPVARVEGLRVRFDIRGGILNRPIHAVHAVAGVSFEIRAGETFSLVGESGCGKSTIAKALTGLVPFEGLLEVAGRKLESGQRPEKAFRRGVQMIFQDPMASLDPRMRVGDLVAEPLVIHGIGSAHEQRAEVETLFERVGLERDQLDRYPHEFSGGQRQRICIARALALRPRLIIADESVSALDVSVQARVLELLKTLKAEFGIAYLFISHDMAVVENVSDRVAVMRLGQIVEMGTRAQLFGDPRHPYTRQLIAAVPVPDPTRVLPPFSRPQGEVPSPVLRRGTEPQIEALADIGGGHMVASFE